jgi:hypothetical protein
VHSFGPVATITYIPKLKHFNIKSITCSSKGSKKRDAINLNLQIGCAVSVKVTGQEKGILN